MKLSDGNMIRKSHPEKLCQKNNLKNFKKFTVKHVSESHFNEVTGLKQATKLVFSCEFCEIFKNTFFYRISLVATSVSRNVPFPQNMFRKKLEWRKTSISTISKIFLIFSVFYIYDEAFLRK